MRYFVEDGDGLLAGVQGDDLLVLVHGGWVIFYLSGEKYQSSRERQSFRVVRRSCVV